jgi:IS30 family transposase
VRKSRRFADCPWRYASTRRRSTARCARPARRVLQRETPLRSVDHLGNFGGLLDWSPEQIAGWLKRTHPEDEYNQVSHETIYRSLFVQARGVLKKELLRHLRSKRSMRRSRPVDPNGDRRGYMKDAVSIRQRPAAVEDRAVPGHLEGEQHLHRDLGRASNALRDVGQGRR